MKSPRAMRTKAMLLHPQMREKINLPEARAGLSTYERSQHSKRVSVEITYGGGAFGAALKKRK